MESIVLMQKMINTTTGKETKLVLCGNWNFETNKPQNTEVKLTTNCVYSEQLFFDNKQTAKKYCEMINNAYDYRLEMITLSTKWELKNNYIS